MNYGTASSAVPSFFWQKASKDESHPATASRNTIRLKPKESLAADPYSQATPLSGSLNDSLDATLLPNQLIFQYREKWATRKDKPEFWSVTLLTDDAATVGEETNIDSSIPEPGERRTYPNADVGIFEPPKEARRGMTHELDYIPGPGKMVVITKDEAGDLMMEMSGPRPQKDDISEAGSPLPDDDLPDTEVQPQSDFALTIDPKRRWVRAAEMITEQDPTTAELDEDLHFTKSMYAGFPSYITECGSTCFQDRFGEWNVLRSVKGTNGPNNHSNAGAETSLLGGGFGRSRPLGDYPDPPSAYKRWFSLCGMGSNTS